MVLLMSVGIFMNDTFRATSTQLLTNMEDGGEIPCVDVTFLDTLTTLDIMFRVHTT